MLICYKFSPIQNTSASMSNPHSILQFKRSLLAIIIAATAISCHTDNQQPEVLPIEGTWELLSETKIEKTDTTFTPAAKNQRMIKIINKTHFAFLRHDLSPVKDSKSIFVAGGGEYNLIGNIYKEHLEFFNLKE